MKRSLLVVLFVVLLTISMVSAQDDVYAGVDPSGQTVIYWHQYSDDSSQGETMAALIAEFNESNEYGITVEGLPQGSYGPIEQLMGTSIVSGELPNLVAGYANAAAGWANEGIVVDVNTLLNSPEFGISVDDQANLNFNLLDVNQLAFEPFNGMRVAWANQNSLNIMYTNLDIVEALGFERRAPETLEEFEAISCAAGENEMYEGYPLDTGMSHFESFIAANGGKIFDAEAGQYVFDSAEVVATLDMFKRMLDSGCAYLYAEAFQNTADFAKGITPLAVGSSAGIPFVVGDAATAEVTDEWVVTALPGAEGVGKTVQLFVPSQVILKSTPEAELATWLFVKWLAEPAQQVRWSSATGYFSIRYDVELTEADLTANMPFNRFIEVQSILVDDTLTVYSSPGLPSYSAVRGIVPDAISAAVNGDAEVAEALAGVNEEANQLHADLDFASE